MQKVLNTNRLEAKIISLKGKLSASSKETYLSNKLAVTLIEGIRFIDFDKIIRLESSSNYTEIHTTSGKNILVSKTMKLILEKLPHTMFVRVHNSHVININFIELLTKEDIHLADQSIVPISRSNRKSVLAHLGLL